MARLVAVLVAALLVLAGCGDDSSPAPSPAAHPFRCPDPKAHQPADRGADHLPAGATGALLCLWDADADWTPPSGPVTAHVDRLVKVVNSRKVLHPGKNDLCDLGGGPAWSMVFRYADGTRTIDGDNGGCKTFFVGSTERDGAERPFFAFLRALVAQRRASSPPDTAVPPPPCPPQHFVFPSFTAQPRTVAAATWCVRRGHRFVAARAADRRELRALRRAFATPKAGHTVHPPLHCHGTPATTYAILAGRDVWGETFTATMTCGVQVLSTGPTRATYIRMSAATRRMVARVVQELEP